jgi:hypothetical protein
MEILTQDIREAYIKKFYSDLDKLNTQKERDKLYRDLFDRINQMFIKNYFNLGIKKSYCVYKNQDFAIHVCGDEERNFHFLLTPFKMILGEYMEETCIYMKSSKGDFLGGFPRKQTLFYHRMINGFIALRVFFFNTIFGGIFPLTFGIFKRNTQNYLEFLSYDQFIVPINWDYYMIYKIPFFPHKLLQRKVWKFRIGMGYKMGIGLLYANHYAKNGIKVQGFNAAQIDEFYQTLGRSMTIANGIIPKRIEDKYDFAKESRNFFKSYVRRNISGGFCLT